MAAYSSWKIELTPRMKIVIVCGVAISVIALACSYRQVMDGLHSMRKRTQVNRMVSAYWSGFKRTYEIRGPLSISQVEKELFGEGVHRKPEDMNWSQEWAKITNDYAEGDELYFFRSDRRSWAHLNGAEGYVLVRGNEIVGCLVTKMN